MTDQNYIDTTILVASSNMLMGRGGSFADKATELVKQGKLEQAAATIEVARAYFAAADGIQSAMQEEIALGMNYGEGYSHG